MDKFDASVTSGIFRLTRIDTNGNEWIVDYSFENDFVCDYPSLILNYYGKLTLTSANNPILLNILFFARFFK